MASLFKTPGHYVFDYKPIYYDPRKESREKRLRSIKKEMGIEVEEVKEEHKPSFDFRKASITRARKDNSSTVRMLVILIILSVFAYIFLYTDLVEKFTNIVS